jgi:hypothetical protein
VKLNPPWAAELLHGWARSDWHDAEQRLGLPSVSPTFRGLLEISTEVDVFGYSNAEIQAVAAAVEHLHTKHAEHYRVLSRHFRPWSRKTLPAGEDDERLLVEAVQMVADFVDKTLG